MLTARFPAASQAAATHVPCVCRHVKLGLLLLKEVKRGPESPWHLWVDSLPQQIDTLIHWSDAELKQLQMDTTATERELLTHVCFAAMPT